MQAQDSGGLRTRTVDAATKLLMREMSGVVPTVRVG